jgi:nitroimidazol reductase NimA-like FMN-containing flavoprotein (pyridoxamine 5'-phosphate oxidase superfamily)
LIPWQQVVEKIKTSRSYWIITTRPSGRPHAMPVWGIWLNDVFLFSTSPESRKARNLKKNPDLVVHLESGDDVVILEGRAEEVMDPALLKEFADVYEAKYQIRPDVSNPQGGYYALRLQVAFAWLESDFPGGATRWEFS